MCNATIVLFTFGAGAFCLPALVHAQTTRLDPFVGRDLWKRRLSYDERLALEVVVGKVPKGQMTVPAPWHVWTVTDDGQTRYIVLLGESLMLIPGGSSACVQLFDATANRINSWSFQLGWRADLYDASIKYSKDLASELLTFHTAPVINGRNITKEYFALNNDRLRFVRMENDKGALVQNEYVFPNYEIGIVPDAHTVEQWSALLESKDKADVLSALIFLGGKHIDEPERRLLPGPHESKYVGLFRELIGDARIRELIERLCDSNNEWIRQAALLARPRSEPDRRLASRDAL
jgi:hypothetical protein